MAAMVLEDQMQEVLEQLTEELAAVGEAMLLELTTAALAS
jgi:hypothetical protein